MADKTTFSSRSKIAQLHLGPGGRRDELASPTRVGSHLSSMRRANCKTMPENTIKRPVARNLMTTTTNATKPRLQPLPPATERRPTSSTTTSTTSLTTSTTTIKRPPTVRNQLNNTLQTSRVPDTNQIRRGLAKFSNPMECQRQFQALSSQIQQLEKTIESRDKTVDNLETRLKYAIDRGVSYATVVQYLALKLKLDSKNDLTEECQQLKSRVEELTVQEAEFENKLENIITDYKNHLQVELDLRNKLNDELNETNRAHLEFIDQLKETHKNELLDLNQEHSETKANLDSRIENLESELRTNIRDLSELRKEHEILINDFNKLEESLTKDKDARVKYLQEKINQLQKDVDSLNSVLEMKTERIHLLERDSLMLIEAQNDAKIQQDTIKTLTQQLESLNAALDKKREQFETLKAEHEQLRQDLKKERTERRLMTMKSEQLEYVLNESCASESNIVFNQNGVRDVDSDKLI